MRCSHAISAAAILAVATSFAAIPSPATANPSTSYAFAQQKVYGMTLSAAPGSNATISGDPAGFAVKMSTDASIAALGLGVSFNGGLDPRQSFVTPALPAAPAENYSGNAPVGFSTPAGERVLLQHPLVTTAAGVPNGFTTTAPVVGDFTDGFNFARSDAYATPNPDTAVAPPGSGTPPANVPPGSWPPSGTAVPSGKIFAAVGTPGTLSIDSVAEANLTTAPHDALATGVSDWTATGVFFVSGAAGSRAVVSFDFSLVERLVVFSTATSDDGAVASNRLSLDIFDSSGRSVFGPLLGANPSSIRMLTSVSTFAETYNNATAIPGHLYPGPVNVNFQSTALAPGRYSFAIKGGSTAMAVAVPEPGTTAALAAAAATLLAGGAIRRRRRMPQA